MPNARRRPNRKSRVRKGYQRKSTSGSAAEKLQRKTNAKRGGSLSTRAIISNKNAIKRLNSSIERVYVTSQVALEGSSYVGQLLNIKGLDCLGCPNQLSGISLATPTTQGTAPATFNYKPVVLRPIAVQQMTPTLVTQYPSQTRKGEDIEMKWLTIKGSVSAYASSSNGTNPTTTVDYRSRPAIQKVRFHLVLDRAPPDYTVSNSYDLDSAPGYVYRMDNLAYPPGNPITTQRGNNYLRDLAKSPFGTALADGTVDPWAVSFYENDHVQTSDKWDKKRFKVLKSWTCTVQQENGANAPNSIPSHVNFSYTHKAPYKFHFKGSQETQPDNQNLLVFMTSDTRVPIGNADTFAPICCPKVNIQAKLCFVDP